MLRYKIEPRNNETNATGHIDHTVIPVWFELARTPVYQLFNPDMAFATWNTVIRKIEIDYLDQVFHDRDTEVRTGINSIKNTSFTVVQELWQEQDLVARGKTVLVHFDYMAQKKLEIPQSVRERLLELIPSPGPYSSSV